MRKNKHVQKTLLSFSDSDSFNSTCFGRMVSNIQRFETILFRTNYLENENVIIKGNVHDVDKRTSYSVYYLKDIQVYRKSTWVKINRERVLVNVKDSDSIMVGNIIQAAGKIYFFQENRNPGNFNQKFYMQID